MKLITKVFAILLLTGCASRPDAIAPISVPASDYANLSCQQTAATLSEKRDSLAEAERQQSRAATGDAVGVFLILIPTSTLFGGDNEGVVAQLKGEVIALERAIGLNCD
ncbi:MAG: hypothetical protein P8M72_12370 [Gammaproteobacteria bacterium]|nr:hypothetical protein [Gammaproteobacteria bacterium]